MEQSLQLARTFFPMDTGPIYQETPLHVDHSTWLIEPWNAISSLLIIVPGIYFLYKLRGRFRSQIFLTICAVLLILGGTGSTLFHGLRTEPGFLLLDWLPTAILFLLVIGYLWNRVVNNIWIAIGILLGMFGLSVLTFVLLPPQVSVNVAYGIRGVVFFLPLVIILSRTQYKNAALMFGGVIFFGLALLFRSIDKETGHLLPMGTHFLWHVSTGIGGLLVAEYIYRLNGLQMNAPKRRRQTLEIDLSAGKKDRAAGI
ncbi:MAG: ceramidase domain-containing protein [Bacteroidota bacterium]